MKQPAKLLTVTFLLMGCQGTSTNTDPFVLYGPQRIPPPATGSLGQTAPPYDQPAASMAPALPPMQSQPPPADLQLPPSGLPARTGNAVPMNATSALTLPPDRWEAPESAVVPAGGMHPPERQAQNVRLQESDNLRWGLPQVRNSDQSVRQASANSPFGSPPNITTAGAGRPRRATSAVASPPGIFVPQGQPVDMSQLPVAGYTPDTFDPLAGQAPGHAATGGAHTIPSHGVVLPADPRANLPIGTGVTAPASATPSSSTAKSLQWKRR